ncbi:MAG: M23 family metallopeptidase [Propionibacteriaceae bacterium]
MAAALRVTSRASTPTRRVALGILAIGVLAGCANAAGTPAATPSSPGPSTAASDLPHDGGIDPGTTFTAVVAATVAQPAPVEASDGKVHLAYELLITNASALRVRIDRIEARDAAAKKTILTKSGAALQRDFTPVSGSRADEGTVDPSADPSTSTLAPSEVWVAWMDASVPTRADVPARLDHRLVGALLPPGNTKPIPFDIAVANVEVNTQPPTVLSAPVKGGIWYMSEGCCRDDTHHRRGLAPVNGELMVPQRFAIDFYKLDDQYRTWVGDPKKLDSYLTYRQPIIAAAAGTVVRAEDGLPNSTAVPKPPPIPPITETVGNHVIVEIGPGTYVLYAHMDPRSVKVRVGQQVEKGQELGLIGTSGNSTTPHVHFQLLSTPTFFPSNSLPYVFDQFDLQGRITQRLWDDNLGLEPTGKLPFKADPAPGPHQNELPVDRAVVRFTGTG